MRSFTSADDFAAAVGEPLGTTPWRTITQEQINLFADATDDHQWIHVDPAKAADGPFGTTIAHGYLSLSLLAAFGAELMTVENVTMAVNVGLDRVRFLTPVKVGSKVRDVATITDVRADGGKARVAVRHTVEIEGEEKPALIAESIVLFYF